MSAIGALAGLILAIVLIIRKVSPTYSLILGAFIGGVLGGFSVPETVAIMIDGVKDVTPAIVRILTAGVLSGVLIKTGAAASISHTIVRKVGTKHVYLALALATMLLTTTGVFIDVAVITVAPIALTIGRQLLIPKAKLLFVMVGGGKCGNIISPNPNTIISAENFNADLSSVMFVNIIPALIGLFVTAYIVVHFLPKIGEMVKDDLNEDDSSDTLPSFTQSMVAPIVTIALLALRPLFGVVIDPLLALPAGGLAGILVMRKWNKLSISISYGLDKMSTIAILLVGTGTIAGIVKASTIKDYLLQTLAQTNLGEVLIAPFSGALMSAATASTTAGATVASASFAETIIAAGISAVWGAAMINVGATVLDHLPHGSFFHATGGATYMQMSERMKIIPFETLIGLVLTICSVAVYFVFGKWLGV